MTGKSAKDAAAETRAPLALLPAVAVIEGSLACREGAKKYGAYNWREKPISQRGQVAAAYRHLLRLLDGESIDRESGVSHAGHVIACMAILLDASANGTAIADLPPPGPGSRRLDEVAAWLEGKKGSPTWVPLVDGETLSLHEARKLLPGTDVPGWVYPSAFADPNGVAWKAVYSRDMISHYARIDSNEPISDEPLSDVISLKEARARFPGPFSRGNIPRSIYDPGNSGSWIGIAGAHGVIDRYKFVEGHV